MKKKVVVQIPCLNEEKGIVNVIKQIVYIVYYCPIPCNVVPSLNR